jgi:hypothetical protein
MECRINAQELLLFRAMYASSQNSKVYHLVRERSQTLCGLKVFAVTLSQPRGPSIHMIQTEPVDRMLCKHCERIEQENG